MPRGVPKVYRVDKDHLATVRDPESGIMVVPAVDEEYSSSHPLVKAYPWMFKVYDSRNADDGPDQGLGRVETTRQVPGEGRTESR